MIHDPEHLIRKIMEKRSVAYISSIDSKGYPNTRSALPPRHTEGIKILYFISATDMMRTRQFKDNPKACVYFYEKHSGRGIQLLGTMEVLTDAQSKGLVWRSGDVTQFQEGPDDQGYCALRFTAQSGRFYSDLRSEEFVL